MVPPSCDEMQEYSLYPVRGPAVSPLQTMVTIEGKVIPMEVDTGASITVVSEATLASIWGQQPVPPLQSTTVKLRTYTGSEIPVVGELTIRVRHQDQQLELLLVIVAGSGPSLLGRDWLSKMHLDWQGMFATQREETLADVIQRHEGVFQEGLGRIKGEQATLHINPEVKPRFYKPRSLPHAMRSKVEDELNRLETDGIIVPVQHSDWATPIVPVLKRDGSVRICGDFKLTANVATKLEIYPLPRIDDGVGAVLSHCMEDGSERPLAYASRSLSVAESKYSHLDKEALAIVFGVKHFHEYVYGHPFTIHSDHKPLMYIFDETKSVPSMASARVQRWALTLRAYTYKIRYKAVHGLSRLPLPSAPADVPQPAETVLLMEHLESSPVSAMDIRSHTNRDPVLSKVRELVMHGWPDTVEKEELQPFVKISHELSVECGCLLRGSRVVIPASLQEKVLALLHDGYPGMVKMKSLAHQYVWWPGVDKALEDRVKQYAPCQETWKAPSLAPLHVWEWPTKPWI